MYSDVTMVDSTSSQDDQDGAALSVILPKKVDMFTLKQVRLTPLKN